MINKDRFVGRVLISNDGHFQPYHYDGYLADHSYPAVAKFFNFEISLKLTG